MKNPLYLMVATPAYGCQMHMDYHDSMLALKEGALRSNIDIDFVTIGNQSLVPKARNDFASYFYFNKKYTHLIFIDADVGIPSNCIPTLLKREVDIIGVPVPLKGFDEKGFPVLNIGEILDIFEDGLAETIHVGNAVLMFSRKAINSLVQVSDTYFNDPKFSRGSFLTEQAYDIFRIGVINERYYPEDYYVCHRLKELGYKIYIDLTIPVRHNGMHTFQTTDDLLAHLRRKNNG